ncbi:MAG: ABC transporter ATP-binding protein [Lachnospiraceae bacterium]|nr:ABC transporter ATP-binding protein [Lachnospiraceae bacterium]
MEAWFQCRQLTKVLDGYCIRDIDFGLEAGRVLGLVGTNGSGKTTLLRCLLGSYRIGENEGDRGDIELDGKHFQRDQQEFRQSLACVMQAEPFYGLMSASEVGQRYGYFYRGFDLKKYMGLLKTYEVPARQSISTLSAGQAMRLQFAFMQSHEAKLYILDEPVGNLDVEFRETCYELIRELSSKGEKAVILSSHLVTELERIADTLLWLYREGDTGRQRYFGETDALRDRYRLLSTDRTREELQKSGIGEEMIAGCRLRPTHSEYLLYDAEGFSEERLRGTELSGARCADLQEIIYYTEKGEER